MKKVLIAGLIAVSAIGAQAHEFRGYQPHYGSGFGWVGPALIGGVIGYEMSRPPVVYQPQPQVVYQQSYPQVYPQTEYRTPPVYSQQYPAPVSCTPAYTAQGQYIGCIR